jgi:superfamily II DNA or RNA helicase
MNTEGKASYEKLSPLKNPQKEAIDFIWQSWFRRKQNSLCALSAGLGKTRVACEIIYRLINDKEVSNSKKLLNYTLVCCSTQRTRDTIWVDTLAEYGLKTMVLEGSAFDNIKMKNKKCLTIPPRTVCLITYANLIRSENDGTPIINYFKNSAPYFIIFDEIHTLSNSSDKENQKYRNVVLELPFSFRLGLTATPLVNTEDEMVLAYGLLNNPSMCRYFMDIKMKEQKEKAIEYVRNKNFFYFKNLPYTKTPSCDSLISIPMEKELYEKYNELCNTLNVKKQVNQQNQVLRFLIEGSFKKKSQEIIYQAETGKMKALRLIVEHINQDDKIIIFDSFTHTLDYIAQQKWIRLFNPVVHHGGKSNNHNNESYKQFMENDKCRIFLTTRSQCGEGVNLQVANHVVILNCWWTVKDLIQMIGRIKRMDQNKPVYSYLLGYNTFSLMPVTKNSKMQDYLLPEELSLYQAVAKKVFVNELWEINVREQLPILRAFESPQTFERDFFLWLDGTIIPDFPRLDSEEEKRKREELEAEENNLLEKERQQKFTNTLLAYLLLKNG